MARKYSRSASKDVERVMRKRKRGSLKSGSGRKVKSRKQAIAIGLSEARRKGKKVPRKSTGRKGAARKTKGRKSSGSQAQLGETRSGLDAPELHCLAT